MHEKPEGEDPWLAFLREETPYLDDAGFSGQIMRALPPPRRVREGIIAGSFILAFFLLALGLFFSDLPMIDLIRGISRSPSLFWGFWGISGLLTFIVLEEKVTEA